MLKRKMVLMKVVFLVMGVLLVSAEETPSVSSYNPGYTNICAFGAVPNDGKDDTEAFNEAGSTIYVPAGVYEISETINLQNKNLVGSGTDKTVIIANMESEREPIILAEGRLVIRDLTIKFRDGLTKGDELMGERVGIYSGGGVGHLKRGASVTNVRIENVGTGIYSPSSSIVLNPGGPFSVTFESISVVDFSFRGFDLENELRTGNVYRSIYLSSGKYEANSAFYLSGEESEFNLSELTVANSKLKTPIRFNQQYAMNITNINIISTELTQDNTGYIYFENTAGYIEAINFIDCAPAGIRQSFIRLGHGMYRKNVFDTAGYVRIGALNILNGNRNDPVEAAQRFVARKNGYVNEFTLKIDHYRIEAPEAVKAQYESFVTDDKEINLYVNGREVTKP